MFGEFTTCSDERVDYYRRDYYDPYEDYYEEIEVRYDTDISSMSFFLHFGYRIF